MSHMPSFMNILHILQWICHNILLLSFNFFTFVGITNLNFKLAQFLLQLVVINVFIILFDIEYPPVVDLLFLQLAYSEIVAALIMRSALLSVTNGRCV